ncbi:glycoside hydrolase family 2 protein [Daejeonella lutea]|uniref:Glycosyl hydrolases family 2, TIM barrel domain n=1 Tax=Daejeonella lutea TaxID=572036 RepID=A0A1T5ASB0_9SPHI|nr:sugar-binding domain-containing protein [Daejeonella lutea]SKB37941.1 Glycosyl hydrolases family 2, TIM barrel domain [Daejeonella lutea]
MNKKLSLFLFCCFSTSFTFAQYSQKPVSISTQWAKDVNDKNAWQEYPRPQLVRDRWLNLNGLWDYKITAKGNTVPSSFDGKILVPYSVESSLSGVQKPLLPDQELWYEKLVNIPADWKGQDVILHFGAVDWQSTIYINDKEIGQHTGGSDPFSFNITSHLKPGVQKILVKVTDPTDSYIQARGKQVLNPQGFWYTAVSGIWQTVWLEPVHATSISYLNPVADIDNGKIAFQIGLTKPQGNEIVEMTVSHKNKEVKKIRVPFNKIIEMDMQNAALWSPDNPNLYKIKVNLSRGGRVLDNFSSYFTMRKISMGTDDRGYTRIMLNNKPVFQWGTLDQGWWPESLLTPPSDAAMKYDMEVLKKMGFNMIRKHIKVEPARYYYHADTLGMLLWQDMPSGFTKLNDPVNHIRADDPNDWVRPKKSAEEFEAEWKSIMDNLRFFGSIVVWVPFNEGWGQYDTKRITAWTQSHDPSRLVDATSGWTDRKVGHMYDAHQYPGPAMEPAEEHPGRAIVLGEFGGLGWPVKGHLWNEAKRNWGYRTFLTEAEYKMQLNQIIRNLYPMLSKGLSAAIYTQTSDVEGEVNGLMTYDRRYNKISIDAMKEMSEPLYHQYPKARILIADSEIKLSKMFTSNVDEDKNWKTLNSPDGRFKEVSAPVKLSKGQNIRALSNFTIEQVPQKLAMKLYGQGDLTVFLNGQEIYNKKILTRRHYDEFNISQYHHLIKPGDNVLAFELKKVEADSDFDFGLYRFD